MSDAMFVISGSKTEDGKNEIVFCGDNYTVNDFIKNLELDYKNQGDIIIFVNNNPEIELKYEYGEIINNIGEYCHVIDCPIKRGTADIISEMYIKYNIYI